MVYSVRDVEMELSDLSHVDNLWFLYAFPARRYLEFGREGTSAAVPCLRFGGRMAACSFALSRRYPSLGSVPALLMWPSSVSHTCLAGVPWDKRFERSVSGVGSQCSFGGSQINSLPSIEHTRCRQIHLVDSSNQFCSGLRV